MTQQLNLPIFIHTDPEYGIWVLLINMKQSFCNTNTLLTIANILYTTDCCALYHFHISPLQIHIFEDRFQLFSYLIY